MTEPIDPSRCPLCGGPNDCALAAGTAASGPCWCADKPFPHELLARVPARARNRACICPRCWSRHAGSVRTDAGGAGGPEGSGR